MKDFITDYLHESKKCSESLRQNVDNILKIKDIIKKSPNIFICGNGGSSATASHFANDLQKICRLKAYCLSDNTPLLTAISNDESYSKIFINQLKLLAKTGDTIIILSGSGKSNNIKNIVPWAIDNNLNVVAFIGMDGGFFKNKKKINLININTDMQHSEEWHLTLTHLITKLIEGENKNERKNL